MSFRTCFFSGLIAGCSVAALAGCSDDEPADAGGAAATGGAGGSAAGTGGKAGSSASGGSAGTAGSGGGAGGAAARRLELELQRLEPIGPDFVFEGWVMVAGKPESSGRFNIEPNKASYAFDLSEAQAAATAFVLTLEPASGDDPAPADTKILGGDFVAGEATLGISHAAALGSDFKSAAGRYLLETPTTTVTTDYSMGVWFLDPSSTPPRASLMLPELPKGWVYEGWVVGASGPVSTGRFMKPDVGDSDGAGPTAGSEPAPPFPGQDFIDPPVDLADGQHKVVITLEPEPDDSPMPFVFKPLADDAEDVKPPALQPLMNDAASAPAGKATIK